MFNVNEVIDQNILYYFLHLDNTVYRTAFIGFAETELIEGVTHYFNSPNRADRALEMMVPVGEIRQFISCQQPLYMIGFFNDGLLNFAGDDVVLDLFPSGNVPPTVAPIKNVNVPTFWKRGVESILDFKIEDCLYRNESGVWVPQMINFR